MSSPIERAFADGRTQYRLVTIKQNADTLLAGASEKRIAIHFISLFNPVFVWPEVMAATTSGIPVGSSPSTPQSITQWQHGDMATREWHAYTATAGNILIVIEVFAPCPCATGHGN